jgi:AcrR family transcriptional regulator
VRARKRQERTEEILATAMQILVDGGSPALTMRALAKSLSLTPGAVYRYFDGKDAIISALALRTMSRYSEALNQREQQARQQSRDLPETHRDLFVLLARALCYWELSVADPSGRTLINFIMNRQEQVLTQDAHDRFVAAVSVQLQRFAALCDATVAAGAMRPGNSFQRSLVCLSLVHGNLQQIKLANTSPIPFESVEIMQMGLDSVLIGWGAEAAHLKALWPLVKE